MDEFNITTQQARNFAKAIYPNIAQFIRQASLPCSLTALTDQRTLPLQLTLSARAKTLATRLLRTLLTQGRTEPFILQIFLKEQNL